MRPTTSVGGSAISHGDEQRPPLWRRRSPARSPGRRRRWPGHSRSRAEKAEPRTSTIATAVTRSDGHGRPAPPASEMSGRQAKSTAAPRPRSSACRRRSPCSGRTTRRLSSTTVPYPAAVVELGDPSAAASAGRVPAHGTILAIGSSTMSVAPASLQRRDQDVDLVLGHDGLDGVARTAEQLVDGRRLHRRQEVDHRVERRRRARSSSPAPCPGRRARPAAACGSGPSRAPSPGRRTDAGLAISSV